MAVGRARITVPVRERSSPPRRNDKIWVQERLEERKQPNGYIQEVDWENREVVVHYWDCNDVDTFSFDDLEGKWTDMYEGSYILQPEPPPYKPPGKA